MLSVLALFPLAAKRMHNQLERRRQRLQPQPKKKAARAGPSVVCAERGVAPQPTDLPTKQVKETSRGATLRQVFILLLAGIDLVRQPARHATTTAPRLARLWVAIFYLRSTLLGSTFGRSSSMTDTRPVLQSR